MKYSKPIIERFGEDIEIDILRKSAAEVICQYFADRSNQDSQRAYYNAVEYLLKHRDSKRILLYLPFDELASAPKSFRDAYRNAWYSLLGVYDARENFHKGDTFELDARPNGELERVVKCAHLTPWLLAAGYIDCSELLDILHYNGDDPILLRSFRDVFGYIYDHKLLSPNDLKKFHAVVEKAPPREPIQPLYVSQKRIEWLDKRNQKPGKLLTPNAHLEGPFSPNLKLMEGRLEQIRANLAPDEIVLIGGSRLKGYGTVDSDLDIWSLRDLENDRILYPGSLHSIHIFFNSAWIGGKNVTDVPRIAKEKIASYIGVADHRMLLERLESDLLQYRLLHKGFSTFIGKRSLMTSPYPEMDGDCPFYDDEYRRIATMLYVKYVLIPKG